MKEKTMRWNYFAMALVTVTAALGGCSSAPSDRASEGASALDDMSDLAGAEGVAGTADMCVTCSSEDLAAVTEEGSLPEVSTGAGGVLRGSKILKLGCTTLKGTLEVLKATNTLLKELLALLREVGGSARIWVVTKESGEVVRVAWSELTRAQKVGHLAELGLKFTVAKASYEKAIKEYERAKSEKLCDAEMEEFKKNADAFLKTVEELEKKRAEQEKEERSLLNQEQFKTPRL